MHRYQGKCTGVDGARLKCENSLKLNAKFKKILFKISEQISHDAYTFQRLNFFQIFRQMLTMKLIQSTRLFINCVVYLTRLTRGPGPLAGYKGQTMDPDGRLT